MAKSKWWRCYIVYGFHDRWADRWGKTVKKGPYYVSAADRDGAVSQTNVHVVDQLPDGRRFWRILAVAVPEHVALEALGYKRLIDDPGEGGG